jgi:hypothetical protein
MNAFDKTSTGAFVLIFLILVGTFVSGCMEPTLPNTPQAAPSQQTPQGYECTITDYGNNVIGFQCTSMLNNGAPFARSLSRYLGETNASVVGITAGANSFQEYIVVVKR